MSGREWEEIELIRQQLESDDKARIAEAERVRLQQQEERSRREKEAQRLAQQQMEERMHTVSLAASHVKRIFKDLAANNSVIKRFPLQTVNQSEINESSYPSTTVSLKWGNKFGLTPEEKLWVEKNEYIPNSFGGLFASTPPESILKEDFYNISAHIDSNNTTIGRETVTSESINAAPDSIVNPVARTLHEVSHSYEVLTKGSDYWKDPRLSRSSTSSDIDCCCCCNQGQ